MVGTPTTIGDFVVYVRGGGRFAAKLRLGRVVRLTGKGVAIRTVWYGQGYDARINARTPESWHLDSSETVAQPLKYLRITQHSIPPEAFVLLDEMEIK